MEYTTAQESERRKTHKKKKKKKHSTISEGNQESIVFGDANGFEKEEQATIEVIEQPSVARKDRKHKKSSKVKREAAQSDNADTDLQNEKQSTPKRIRGQRSSVLESSEESGSRNEDKKAATEQPPQQSPVAGEKQKISSKTGQESTQSDSNDSNVQNETQSTPDLKKESKRSPAKMAPTEASTLPRMNREWSNDQERRLLENVGMYASKLMGKERDSSRVNWSKVEKVDNFTEAEIQNKYKELTKGVRKLRSTSEIVGDALTLHVERKNTPATVRKRPKQRPNAFSVFCKAKRPSFQEKYPDLKFIDVHKRLCQRWKELSDDKRTVYIDKAEEAKKEYDEEMRKLNEEKISALTKPMTAYEQWKAERLKDDSIDGDETESDFLLEWENLPKSKKTFWYRHADLEQDRYDTEVRSITGESGRKRKSVEIAEDKKSVSETKTKGESTSDELRQQSSSSLDNSGFKRKSAHSEPPASPVRKSRKNESSGSGSDSDSS